MSASLEWKLNDDGVIEGFTIKCCIINSIQLTEVYMTLKPSNKWNNISFSNVACTEVFRRPTTC